MPAFARARRLLPGGWLLVLVTSVGCGSRACSLPTGLAEASQSLPAPSGPASGIATTVEVPGDAPVTVVHASAEKRNVLVFLHGRCSHPDVDIASWAQIASLEGTLLVPRADQPCPGVDADVRRWTGDLDQIQARIDAALAVVGASRAGGVDTGTITLIGYSEGSARAEALAGRSPERYRRVILIGSPEIPSPVHLGQTLAVAFLAGEKDRQDLMRSGQRALETGGKHARFFELPGAEHGEFGPEGGRVMGEALTWLGTH